MENLPEGQCSELGAWKLSYGRKVEAIDCSLNAPDGHYERRSQHEMLPWEALSMYRVKKRHFDFLNGFEVGNDLNLSGLHSHHRYLVQRWGFMRPVPFPPVPLTCVSGAFFTMLLPRTVCNPKRYENVYSLENERQMWRSLK